MTFFNELVIDNEVRVVQTVGGMYDAAATTKYRRPCARKRSLRGDLEGCCDSFTKDNTRTRKS